MSKAYKTIGLLDYIGSRWDASKGIVSFAEKGIYSRDASQLVNASIFERLTEAEMAEMFDWEGDQAKVKSWLREGITWHFGDATDPELINILGPRDMVAASNFLCHMAGADAEKCLANIARLLVQEDTFLFQESIWTFEQRSHLTSAGSRCGS
jgi:chemotaxis methyl-accepting protein methylase